MSLRQRQPRRERPKYLAFIRSLPCLICGRSGDTHAAHVRMGDRFYGKDYTGAGRKPDDLWCVPLCTAHHVLGPDAQHNRGEAAWWREHGINPFVICGLLALHYQNDDEAGAREVCYYAIGISKGA